MVKRTERKAICRTYDVRRIDLGQSIRTCHSVTGCGIHFKILESLVDAQSSWAWQVQSSNISTQDLAPRTFDLMRWRVKGKVVMSVRVIPKELRNCIENPSSAASRYNFCSFRTKTTRSDTLFKINSKTKETVRRVRACISSPYWGGAGGGDVSNHSYETNHSQFILTIQQFGNPLFIFMVGRGLFAPQMNDIGNLYIVE